MKFREHRGSLEHSMATVVEIGNTFTDVCNHARVVLASISGGLEPGELLLPTPIGLSAFSDTRIGWEGFTVSLVGWGVVGFIDDTPEDTPPEAFTGSHLSLKMKDEFVFTGDLTDTGAKYYFPVADATVAFNWMHELNGLNQDGTAKAPKERMYQLYELMDSANPPAVAEQVDEPVSLEVEESLVINELLDQGITNMGQYSGADFFNTMKEKLRQIQAGEVGQAGVLIAMIDSLPSELQAMTEVRKGMVVLPDAEHMTESMVDATRGLHLYYMEAGSGVTCEQMRKHLRRYAPWAAKHYPQWFKDDNSHLTKAGRAILAHALTVGAHQDPEARQHYFKVENSRRQRVWDNPMHQRIRLTFKPLVMGEEFNDGGFVVHVPFLAARPADTEDSKARNVGRYELQLNRSDMPKPHRGKFKSEAFTMSLELIEKGQGVSFIEWQVGSKVESSSYVVIPTMTSRW